MLTKKEVQVLKLMYQNRHTFQTSQDLAAQLFLSDRTVRKYLHNISQSLEEKGLASIQAKRSLGYQLLVTQEKEFEAFYKRIVTDFPTTAELRYSSESLDRQYYILSQLFFEEKEISLDSLSEELFVSHSTLSNDLVEIKKLLKPYTIQLKSKEKRGLYLVGREQDFRRFMMNYFFMKRWHDNMYNFSTYTNLLTGISVEEIVIIVLDECRDAHLKLSDFIIYNLVLHIALALKRLQNHFKIEQLAEMSPNHGSKEYQTALKIVQRLEKSASLTIPKEEAEYIALHLQNDLSSKKAFQKIPFSETDVKAQISLAIEGIEQATGYQISQDNILLDGLLMHFTPLLLRLENQKSLENPLLPEIKERYGNLLNLTIHYFSTMPVLQSYQISENEWSYLTIHISAAVERFFNAQKTHVLVVCATGLGSSQMLKSRLEHELGSKIIIEKVCSYYEVSQEDVAKVDLIISSINLPNVIYNVPIVYVSVFLDAADIENINQKLAKSQRQLFTQELIATSPNEQLEKTALIDKYFQADLFFRFKQAQTKDNVLEELLAGIQKQENQPVIASLTKQLELRETYSSVVFSEFLAVPHPIEAITDDSYVAIAVAPKGISWSEKAQNIQLVFLLSPDKLGQGSLELISQLLAEIIEDDQLRQGLVASQNFQEFKEVFTQGVL